MKILFHGHRKHKKRKVLRCHKCGTIFVSRFCDCERSLSFAGPFNWYATCPKCGHAVFYDTTIYGD